MARRIRHDLIKHLDIPQSQQTLTPNEAHLLLRRLFDSATGVCSLAPILAFKFRRDPDWDSALEPALKNIESHARSLKKRETTIKNAIACGGILDDASLALIDAIVQAVKNFENDTQTLVPDDGKLDDQDAALAFFDFSQPANPEPAPFSAPTAEKRHILIVDDHTMLLERLLAHPTFSKRWSFAPVCGESMDCASCKKSDDCMQRRARNAKEAVFALQNAHNHHQKIDAILMDVRFDDLTVDELLWLPDIPALNTEERVKALQGLIIARHLRNAPPFDRIPIILTTAKDRLPEGAKYLLPNLEGLQFVDDDDSLDTLAARVESLVQSSQKSTQQAGYFWGNSPLMLSVRRQIEIMSIGPRTMFITGPSGAGKSSLVEHIIYPLSGRRPLITLDLSAIPDTLVESELFGHVKGAYSGALSDRPGLIEEADGGILFLDEIGNLSPENQRKLLLFLQDKTVRRVGAPQQSAKRVNVKVIVATHLDLEAEVHANRFRFDLYMRFSPAMRITLPAIAEHKEDLPEFIEMLVQKLLNSEDMKPHVDAFRARTHTFGNIRVDFKRNLDKLSENEGSLRFRQATRELFMKYDWPGNTRELESVLDALVLKGFYDLKVANSPSRIIEIDPYYALSLLGEIRHSALDTVSAQRPIDTIASHFSNEIGCVADFAQLRQTLEQRFLCKLFEECECDMARMAQHLFGDDSETARHKIIVRMNQLGISVRRLKKNKK